jgi:hypothetical protein
MKIVGGIAIGPPTLSRDGYEFLRATRPVDRMGQSGSPVSPGGSAGLG